MTDSASFGTSSPADSYSFRRIPTHEAVCGDHRCTGSSVVVHVGGDIDASNQTIWQHLAESGRRPAPSHLVCSSSTFASWISWDRAVMPSLAHEAARMPRSRHRSEAGLQPGDRGPNDRQCGLRPLLPTYTTVETALADVTGQRRPGAPRHARNPRTVSPRCCCGRSCGRSAPPSDSASTTRSSP